jgi:ribosomal protein S18 acetylase RimI-like enzyme
VVDDITDPNDRVVVQALEQNLWEMWSRFGRGDGCVLHEEADAIWFDTPIPTLPYNAVIRFAAEDDVDRRIDAIFDHYRRRGVPFMWIAHPSAQPPDLDERLRARGVEEAEVCPGMSMNLADLPEQEETPAGFEIREATEEADMSEVLELVAWRWGVPQEVIPLLAPVTRAFEVGSPGGAVRTWIAEQHGVPVAKAVVNLAAGVAGIYGVATKPEVRGLGLARILTLQALREARERGYDRGVLHSTPVARSLYEKIGFRTYSPFRIFAPPQTFHL